MRQSIKYLLSSNATICCQMKANSAWGSFSSCWLRCTMSASSKAIKFNNIEAHCTCASCTILQLYVDLSAMEHKMQDHTKIFEG